MNRIIVLLSLLLSIDVVAQSRDAGQMVVPSGWETEDSLRWGVFDIHGAGNTDSLATLLDQMQFNFNHEWGGRASTIDFKGKRRGMMSWGHINYPPNSLYDLTALGFILKQRVYYPSPLRGLPYRFDHGYWWRYNIANFNPNSKWYDRTYDSNDISPYLEIPADSSVVTGNYHTRRFNPVLSQVVDSTLKFGNEGKVILAHSENKNAGELLKVVRHHRIHYGSQPDTAKTFSARLDFNIDTSSIDYTGWTGNSDDVPLARLQILFKKGLDEAGDGWTYLPFVPFKTSAQPGNPGWYAVLDTVITRKLYRQLSLSWRTSDTLENGQPARNWEFKQLHCVLKLPQVVEDALKTMPSDSAKWQMGIGEQVSRMTTDVHQDSLIKFDSVQSFPFNERIALLDSRILSTYRSLVRIRSIDWQDTVMDHSFHRRRFGDSSHSVWADGSYGGVDDLVNQAAADWSAATNGTTKEIMFNDMPGDFIGISAPGIAYIDYMASKHGVHAHIREQDFGGYTAHYRRNRRAFDGGVPSMYENQVTIFDAWSRGNQRDYIPHDYFYNGRAIDESQTWPSAQDTMVGLRIARIQTSDSLKAYHAYTQSFGGMQDYALALRGSARAALHFPKHRRFAIESEIQGWGIIHPSHQHGASAWPAPHYHQRVTTPEETQVQIYLSIANGASAMNSAQFIDFGSNVGAPGGLHALHRSSPDSARYFGSSYNFGRHINGGWWNTSTESCDSDDVGYDYYLGYSNTSRAIRRAIDRVNSIYSSTNTDYPLKRLEWLDAYSSDRALNWGSDPSGRGIDSLVRLQSFLKLIKTQPVEHWNRGSRNEYLDKNVTDSAHRTYIEVGLFRDSVLGNGAPKGYAALIVNTRLWPGRDQIDTAYYNEGLPLKDRIKPTLGDIDVRKVYMQIDAGKMHSSMNSMYYVVRDIWHPDTCWLVHRDSQFAVYIKPGDAKFLYIEKGISIRVSPTAETETADFAFNNGRRVAELMNRTRTVVAYTKDDMLYASYPSMGHTFNGYAKNTSGDNIETGREELLDDDWSKKPSVMVAQNDTGVALAYWVRTNSSNKNGEVRVAYRKHPDSSWKFAPYTGATFRDITSTGDNITPVLTPINDTTWLVAARMPTLGATPGGIILFRFSVDVAGQPSYLSGSYEYLIQSSTAKLPTVASRPLDDSLWPVRIAYERDAKIFRRALRWKPGSSISMTPVFEVSKEMPDGCIAKHPSISMAGFVWKFTFGWSHFSFPFITETITWESKITGLQNSVDKLWPVTRSSVNPWNISDPAWGSYTVFRPDSTSVENYHYPIVSTESFEYEDRNRPMPGVWRDHTRIMWQNIPLETIEGRHLGRPMANDHWAKSYIYRNGRHVSLGQTTDTLQRWTDTSMVPKSIVWAAQPGGARKIDITNGWMPQINSVATYDPWYYFVIKGPDEEECMPIKKLVGIEDPRLFPPSGPPRDVPLLPVPPFEETPTTHKWPANPTRPFDVRTDTFTVRPDDSLQVSRVVDSLDVTGIRSELTGPTDYVMFTLRLLRARDSSYVRTIDSLIITPTALRVPNGTPGLLLDYATLKIPAGAPIDTVFIAAEMSRGDTNDLVLGILQMLTKDETLVSAKRTTESQPRVEPANYLKVSIQPNPFNSTTLVTVKTVEGMPTVIELSDALGRKLQTLHDGAAQAGAFHLVIEGESLPAGTYFIRVLSGGEVQTRKIQLVK